MLENLASIKEALGSIPSEREERREGGKEMEQNGKTLTRQK
jgi:hypothetical protein